MRLVDADAFDKRIRAAVGMTEEELTDDFKDGIATILEMLKSEPTIEPERKKTGHWIQPKGMMPPEHHGHYECSECGAWAGRNWLRPWKEIQLSNYCPNCGADMRGEQG